MYLFLFSVQLDGNLQPLFKTTKELEKRLQQVKDFQEGHRSRLLKLQGEHVNQMFRRTDKVLLCVTQKADPFLGETSCEAYPTFSARNGEEKRIRKVA